MPDAIKIIQLFNNVQMYDSKEAAEGCLFAAKYMCGFGS